MQPSEAERPAIAKAMKRGVGIEQLRRRLDFNASKNSWKHQAFARQFGLAPRIAAIVAGLAFATGARR